jgi:hypothetical protein
LLAGKNIAISLVKDLSKPKFKASLLFKQANSYLEDIHTE